MALGDHAGHVVVDAAAEDRAQHDPEEDHRAEAGAHQRAENGPRARDVQKLDEEGLPGLHRDEVHAVLPCVSRRFPVIRAEGARHKAAVEHKAEDQNDQCAKNRDHTVCLLSFLIISAFAQAVNTPRDTKSA